MAERDFPIMPADAQAIDWLAPKSAQHDFILQYLRERIRYSELKMAKFYPRWRHNELMLQAYISMQDFDRILKEMDRSREAPSIDDAPMAINVPFAWATVNTIVTYLLHMFGGRSPIFDVDTYRAEQVNSAKNMEMFIQYNSDVVRFIRSLYFFLMDGETYGLAVMRTLWKQEIGTRMVQVPPHPDITAVAQAQGMPPPQTTQQSQDYVKFEGSSCANVDPYLFYPDPRVPMHEVSEKGEWVSWRSYQGRHTLMKEQAKGNLKWVDRVEDARWQDNENQPNSARSIRAMGVGDPGMDEGGASQISPNLQVDQGTFIIIPKDLGLSASDTPEMWVFTILNKRQIVQAMKVDLPTGRHPVIVAEPSSVGYGFGNLGTVDMVGPMQKIMSWFMNSHIYNVRSALNNMFVVDPTKVEMQDFKTPGPGKLLRLKNTAFGLNDPKMAVSQLEVSDVTRAHMSDFQTFGRLASDLSGATDNVRGLQDAGGRKTATEIRTSSEAATSRLAAKGKVYSAMAFTDLAQTWSLNAQSNLTDEFEFKVLGQEGRANSFRLTPESIQGDFVYPIHDGTLPVDKLGLLDVWKELYLAVSQDPQLRQSYDMLDMFDWIAQLGGAQNIKQFRVNVVPQTQQMNALGGQGPLAAQGIPMQQVLAAMESYGGHVPQG